MFLVALESQAPSPDSNNSLFAFLFFNVFELKDKLILTKTDSRTSDSKKAEIPVKWLNSFFSW